MMYTKSFAYFPEQFVICIFPKQFKKHDRVRYLFHFNLTSFGKPRERNKSWYIITFELFYLETSFRIGNGKNPFWIRNENLSWWLRKIKNNTF